MNKTQILLCVLGMTYLLLHSNDLLSQSVGIGTTSPHPSSRADISSTNKGLLIPRMATSSVSSISNPAKGLMVYDSVKNQLMVNMGTGVLPDWQTIVSRSGWNLTGNSGSDPANHFVGTTDNNPLQFRVNNEFAGQIDSTKRLTCLGYAAAKNTTTGVNNVAMGFKSLHSNTSGSQNTANGNYSLYSNTNGYDNTATGYLSLYFNTGSNNTAYGSASLYSNTTGIGNTAAGYASLYKNTNGTQNTAVGYGSLNNNVTGWSNTAIGNYALVYNTTGHQNTAIGNEALASNTDFGSQNTGVGSYTLYNTGASLANTAVGYSAGKNYNLGWNNTLLGAFCDVNGNDFFNCIAIGQSVTCTASSQARIGNSSTTSIGGQVGWTTFSDGRFKLDIMSDVKGIDFIMKLKPVTYRLDVTGISKTLDEGRGKEPDKFSKQAATDKEKIIYSGFIAQDVEKAAQETGYDFSGVDKPKNEKDFYGLRYAEFVVPLVKAVQELSKQNDELLKRIEKLESLLKIKN